MSGDTSNNPLKHTFLKVFSKRIFKYKSIVKKRLKRQLLAQDVEKFDASLFPWIGKRDFIKYPIRLGCLVEFVFSYSVLGCGTVEEVKNGGLLHIKTDHGGFPIIVKRHRQLVKLTDNVVSAGLVDSGFSGEYIEPQNCILTGSDVEQRSPDSVLDSYLSNVPTETVAVEEETISPTAQVVIASDVSVNVVGQCDSVSAPINLSNSSPECSASMSVTRDVPSCSSSSLGKGSPQQVNDTLRVHLDEDNSEGLVKPEFAVNDLVEVTARTSIGMNFPGGRARISAIHFDEEEMQYEYDVKYVIARSHEKGVASMFIHAVDINGRIISKSNTADVDHDASTNFSAIRRRNILGRCNRSGCWSFVKDCQHIQLKEGEREPDANEQGNGAVKSNQLIDVVLEKKRKQSVEQDKAQFPSDIKDAGPQTTWAQISSVQSVPKKSLGPKKGTIDNVDRGKRDPTVITKKSRKGKSTKVYTQAVISSLLSESVSFKKLTGRRRVVESFAAAGMLDDIKSPTQRNNDLLVRTIATPSPGLVENYSVQTTVVEGTLGGAVSMNANSNSVIDLADGTSNPSDRKMDNTEDRNSDFIGKDGGTIRKEVHTSNIAGVSDPFITKEGIHSAHDLHYDASSLHQHITRMTEEEIFRLLVECTNIYKDNIESSTCFLSNCKALHCQLTDTASWQNIAGDAGSYFAGTIYDVDMLKNDWAKQLEKQNDSFNLALKKIKKISGKKRRISEARVDDVDLMQDSLCQQWNDALNGIRTLIYQLYDAFEWHFGEAVEACLGGTSFNEDDDSDDSDCDRKQLLLDDFKLHSFYNVNVTDSLISSDGYQPKKSYFSHEAYANKRARNVYAFRRGGRAARTGASRRKRQNVSGAEQSVSDGSDGGSDCDDGVCRANARTYAQLYDTVSRHRVGRKKGDAARGQGVPREHHHKHRKVSDRPSNTVKELRDVWFDKFDGRRLPTHGNKYDTLTPDDPYDDNSDCNSIASDDIAAALYHGTSTGSRTLSRHRSRHKKGATDDCATGVLVPSDKEDACNPTREVIVEREVAPLSDKDCWEVCCKHIRLLKDQMMKNKHLYDACITDRSEFLPFCFRSTSCDSVLWNRVNLIDQQSAVELDDLIDEIWANSSGNLWENCDNTISLMFDQSFLCFDQYPRCFDVFPVVSAFDIPSPAVSCEKLSVMCSYWDGLRQHHMFDNHSSGVSWLATSVFCARAASFDHNAILFVCRYLSAYFDRQQSENGVSGESFLCCVERALSVVLLGGAGGGPRGKYFNVVLDCLCLILNNLRQRICWISKQFQLCLSTCGAEGVDKYRQSLCESVLTSWEWLFNSLVECPMFLSNVVGQLQQFCASDGVPMNNASVLDPLERSVVSLWREFHKCISLPSVWSVVCTRLSPRGHAFAFGLQHLVAEKGSLHSSWAAVDMFIRAQVTTIAANASEANTNKTIHALLQLVVFHSSMLYYESVDLYFSRKLDASAVFPLVAQSSWTTIEVLYRSHEFLHSQLTGNRPEVPVQKVSEDGNLLDFADGAIRLLTTRYASYRSFVCCLADAVWNELPLAFEIIVDLSSSALIHYDHYYHVHLASCGEPADDETTQHTNVHSMMTEFSKKVDRTAVGWDVIHDDYLMDDNVVTMLHNVVFASCYAETKECSWERQNGNAPLVECCFDERTMFWSHLSGTVESIVTIMSLMLRNCKSVIGCKRLFQSIAVNCDPKKRNLKTFLTSVRFPSKSNSFLSHMCLIWVTVQCFMLFESFEVAGDGGLALKVGIECLNLTEPSGNTADGRRRQLCLYWFLCERLLFYSIPVHRSFLSLNCSISTMESLNVKATKDVLDRFVDYSNWSQQLYAQAVTTVPDRGAMVSFKDLHSVNSVIFALLLGRALVHLNWKKSLLLNGNAGISDLKVASIDVHTGRLYNLIIGIAHNYLVANEAVVNEISLFSLELLRSVSSKVHVIHASMKQSEDGISDVLPSPSNTEDMRALYVKMRSGCLVLQSVVRSFFKPLRSICQLDEEPKKSTYDEDTKHHKFVCESHVAIEGLRNMTSVLADMSIVLLLFPLSDSDEKDTNCRGKEQLQYIFNIFKLNRRSNDLVSHGPFLDHRNSGELNADWAMTERLKVLFWNRWTTTIVLLHSNAAFWAEFVGLEAQNHNGVVMDVMATRSQVNTNMCSRLQLEAIVRFHMSLLVTSWMCCLISNYLFPERKLCKLMPEAVLLHIGGNIVNVGKVLFFNSGNCCSNIQFQQCNHLVSEAFCAAMATRNKNVVTSNKHKHAVSFPAVKLHDKLLLIYSFVGYFSSFSFDMLSSTTCSVLTNDIKGLYFIIVSILKRASTTALVRSTLSKSESQRRCSMTYGWGVEVIHRCVLARCQPSGSDLQIDIDPVTYSLLQSEQRHSDLYHRQKSVTHNLCAEFRHMIIPCYIQSCVHVLNRSSSCAYFLAMICEAFKGRHTMSYADQLMNALTFALVVPPWLLLRGNDKQSIAAVDSNEDNFCDYWCFKYRQSFLVNLVEFQHFVLCNVQCWRFSTDPSLPYNTAPFALDESVVFIRSRLCLKVFSTSTLPGIQLAGQSHIVSMPSGTLKDTNITLSLTSETMLCILLTTLQVVRCVGGESPVTVTAGLISFSNYTIGSFVRYLLDGLVAASTNVISMSHESAEMPAFYSEWLLLLKLLVKDVIAKCVCGREPTDYAGLLETVNSAHALLFTLYASMQTEATHSEYSDRCGCQYCCCYSTRTYITHQLDVLSDRISHNQFYSVLDTNKHVLSVDKTEMKKMVDLLVQAYDR